MVPRLDVCCREGVVGRQQGHVEDGPLGIGVGLCSDHPLEAICLEEVAHHKTYHLVLVYHLFPSLWGDQEGSDQEGSDQ